MSGNISSPSEIKNEAQNILTRLSDRSYSLMESEQLANNFFKRCDQIVNAAEIPAQNSMACPCHESTYKNANSTLIELAKEQAKIVQNALDAAKSNIST